MALTPLIATSIAPNERIEVQKQAISSWLNIGMEVVSLNTLDEIEELQPIFKGIKFIPQLRTGQTLFGRPYIFISDILNYFRQNNVHICGIINSDISLVADPGLSAFLYKQARNSLVYGPRFQVKSFSDKNGTIDPLGFDYFIFDRHLVSDWHESYFCLGLPSWDHWFPLVSILTGRPVKKIISQIAFHAYHDVRENRAVLSLNNEFVSQIIEYFSLTKQNLSRLTTTENVTLFNEFQFANTYNSIVEKIDNTITTGDGIESKCHEELAIFFDEFTKYSIHFLEKKSEKLEFKSRFF